MDSAFWTCLFLSLVVLLFQPADGEEQGPVTSTPTENFNQLDNDLNDMNNWLEKGCPASSKKPRLKELEGKVLDIGSTEENFMITHSEVQILVFKINSMSFQGLNVTSDMVKDGKNSSLLNNDILGATLGKFNITDLSQPVEIRFWHDLVLDNSNATCVFWVEGTEDGGLGSWSSDGCKTIHQNGTVLCQCGHLTYFAVLLKISSAAIDEDLLAPLTYITMVGCSISAAASLFAILLYLISRKKSRDYTTKIHMNLLGALFLLNISFLLSEPLASTWLCSSTAAFLHYSLFCSLTWMAIEGFHLYLLLIKVYNVYIRRYVLKLCAVGWGLPAFPVICILLVKKEVYGQRVIETGTDYSNATMCWVTDWHVHYILNLGYTAITVLSNMVILVIVTRMLWVLRSKMDSWREQVKKDIVTVLGLTCLLGTTWALAFFSFGAFLIPQLFLFTIINSLQGFFICLWYCTLHRQPDNTSISSRSSQLTK